MELKDNIQIIIRRNEQPDELREVDRESFIESRELSRFRDEQGI